MPGRGKAMSKGFLAACAVAVLAVPAFLVPGSAAGASDALVERGAYLVNTIAACGNCHTMQGPAGPDMTMDLAGGMVIEHPGVFAAHVPNITQDRETGIGTWSDAEIARSIREGIRPDGSLIGPPMPIMLYREVSDDDLAAMVAYLRTVPPIRNAVGRSVYEIPLPASYGPPVGHVPAVSPDDQLAYGAYLAGPMGHCIECHTPMGPGGHPDIANRLGAGGFPFHGPWGVSASANITPAGAVADYDDAELKAAITRGVRPDGSRLMPPMGYGYYAGMTEADLDAIVAYLRSLPPVE